MALPDMNILMQDDLFPFFFGVEPRVDIDGLSKGKRGDVFVDLVDADGLIADEFGLSPDADEGEPADEGARESEENPGGQNEADDRPAVQPGMLCDGRQRARRGVVAQCGDIGEVNRPMRFNAMLKK